MNFGHDQFEEAIKLKQPTRFRFIMGACVVQCTMLSLNLCFLISRSEVTSQGHPINYAVIVMIYQQINLTPRLNYLIAGQYLKELNHDSLRTVVISCIKSFKWYWCQQSIHEGLNPRYLYESNLEMNHYFVQERDRVPLNIKQNTGLL